MEMLTGKSSNLDAGPTDVAVLLPDHCQWRIWSTKQIYVNRVSDRRNHAKMIDTGSDSLHCHDTVTCQCWLERWLRAISMSADSEQHTSEYFACDMWQFDVWPPKRKKRREADLELFSLSNQKKKKTLATTGISAISSPSCMKALATKKASPHSGWPYQMGTSPFSAVDTRPSRVTWNKSPKKTIPARKRLPRSLPHTGGAATTSTQTHSWIRLSPFRHVSYHFPKIWQVTFFGLPPPTSSNTWFWIYAHVPPSSSEKQMTVVSVDRGCTHSAWQAGLRKKSECWSPFL